MAYWWCDVHECPLDDGGCCVKCWKEEEKLQRKCSHPNRIDPQDGCIDCGYAK